MNITIEDAYKIHNYILQHEKNEVRRLMVFKNDDFFAPAIKENFDTKDFTIIHRRTMTGGTNPFGAGGCAMTRHPITIYVAKYDYCVITLYGRMQYHDSYFEGIQWDDRRVNHNISRINLHEMLNELRADNTGTKGLNNDGQEKL